MKLFHQAVAAMVLLLLFGVSGAGCLVPNAQMSAAEKVCCRQMAGLCDVGMATKHSCCKNIAGQNEADLNEAPHFAPALLSLNLPVLEINLSLHSVAAQLFAQGELWGGPPGNPPNSSSTILRI